MKNTAKIKLKNRIRKLLSDKRGFSLGELLAATVILLLASQVMTQGMAFATRMYKESLTRSHAKQLCSTLTNVIEKSFDIQQVLIKAMMERYLSISVRLTEKQKVLLLL